MERSAAGSGSRRAAGNQPGLWRPWDKGERKPTRVTTRSLHLFTAQRKFPAVIHPVKLFWPKSRCFDYLYRDAETLLRNYPVQATICPYQDSSSEEEAEDGDEEEEEDDKKPN